MNCCCFVFVREVPKFCTLSAGHHALLCHGVPRGQEAVEAATHTVLEDGPEYEICLDHFAQPDDPDQYQEPTRFRDGRGKSVVLESCRLCRRFVPLRETYCMTGLLAGATICGVLYQTLKIRLKGENFLKRICQECLVQVELVRTIQGKFYMRETAYRDMEKLLPKQLYEAVEDLPETVDESEVDLGTVKVEIEEQLEPPKPKVIREKKEKVKKDVFAPKRTYIRKKPKKVIPPPKDTWDRVNVIRTRKCYICKIEFETRDEMVHHLTQNHVTDNAYECADCDGLKFGMISSYNSHLSLHDASERPLKCSFCNLRYCIRKVMLIHENRAHGAQHDIPIKIKRPRHKRQCELCGKQFGSLYLERQHKLLVHEQSVMVQCKICSKQLKSYTNLQRHMLQHTGELPHKCDTCGMGFKISTDLNKHIQSDHEGKSPYECRTCKVTLRTKAEYFRHHSKVHRKTARNCKCLACGAKFTTINETRDHIAKSHRDDYPYLTCPECPSLQFTCSVHYSAHRSYKHAGKVRTVPNPQQKDFACQTCDKRFSSKQYLRFHEDTHNKVRRYPCLYCDVSFSQLTQLGNHTRNRHTGEMPFECDKCGKRFKDSSTYSRHRAQHAKE